MTFTAIVPAGGRLSPQDARSCDESVKALLQIGGESLLARLLRELRAVGLVERVVVIGPAETRLISECFGALWTLETNSLLGNVQAGVRAANLSGADPIFLVGSDLAAPNALSFANFLDNLPADAQVAAPLVTRERFAQVYPGSPSTFLTLADGQYTLGSQFTAPAGLLLAPTPAIAAMLGHRKSQLAMALTFGLPFALGLLTGLLTIPALERRASDLLGVPARAVPNSAPDLALDIDNFADYQYALSLTKKQPIET